MLKHRFYKQDRRFLRKFAYFQQKQKFSRKNDHFKQKFIEFLENMAVFHKTYVKKLNIVDFDALMQNSSFSFSYLVMA